MQLQDSEQGTAEMRVDPLSGVVTMLQKAAFSHRRRITGRVRLVLFAISCVILMSLPTFAQLRRGSGRQRRRFHAAAAQGSEGYVCPIRRL